MNKTKLFFDLDGTLIDSTKRLYQLFQNLVPHSKFSFDEYWNLKRDMQTHSLILGNHFNYLKDSIRDFEEKWLEEIEMESWLTYDQPFTGVTQYLDSLKENYELYLVTARQSTLAVNKQIESFGWSSLFKNVLVTNQSKEKSEVILSNTLPGADDWIIGDTGIDIQTGKKLGIKTAAVLSGFRNRSTLEKYHPDVIVNVVTDLNF